MFRARWLRPSACLAVTLMLAASAHAADSGAYDQGAMMRAVAENWLTSQQADGLLPYGFDFLTGQANEDATSSGFIAREAGAIWVWARYYNSVDDARYVEPLRRALDALVTRSIPFGKPAAQPVLDAMHIYGVPFGRMTLARALQSAGLLYSSEGSAKVLTVSGMDGAWTGSTALALLAELEYARATGDQRFAASRHAWRDALLALHVSRWGFRESPVSIDDDDFATAEAWLALADYADFDPRDDSVRRALSDVDDTLIARFTKRPNTPAFQWTSMAALRRWTTTRDPRFAEFARQQSRVFTVRLERRVKEDEFGNRCGAMEGLAAMRSVLAQAGGDRAVRAALEAALAREAARIPRLQITGETRMALGGDGYLVSPARPRFAGAFLWQIYGGETRLDAAAHCLSAMLLDDANPRWPASHPVASHAKRMPQ